MKKLVGIACSLLVVGAVACDEPKPMTQAEIAEATAESGPIFLTSDGRETLEDTPEFYLGQPESEAIAALEARCEAILTYQGGWVRGNTVFKGCKLPDEPGVDSIRIGFTPDAEMRVFTVEVLKRGWTPDQVRARFTQNYGEIVERDIPRAATIRMETPRHRLFGSWEEGEEGVGHVIFGLSPEAVQELTGE